MVGLGQFVNLDDAIACANKAASFTGARVYYSFPSDTLEPDAII